jgi:hypothetical protein
VVVVRGRRGVFWHGHRHFLVPIVALGAFTLGAYCAGYTEDGCVLRWAEVPTEEGDLVPQCVTYCPQ